MRARFIQLVFPAAISVGFAPAHAVAQTAPPAPAAPVATTAPAPAAPPPAAPSSAWDQVIQKSSAQEHALETDEERSRREERLSRPEWEAPPSMRLGARIDLGITFEQLTDQDGDLNGIGAPGVMFVLPLGNSFELATNLDFAFGAGQFFTWGPMLDVQIRWVINNHGFLGVGGNYSLLKMGNERFEYSGCPPHQDYCYRAFDSSYAFLQGEISGGFFLTPHRTFELGAAVRAGEDPSTGDFSFMPTAYAAYLWAL